MGRRGNAVPVSETKMRDKYEAESDLRTLTGAQEIQADKGRMHRVRKHHADQMSVLSKVGARLKSKVRGSKVRR